MQNMDLFQVQDIFNQNLIGLGVNNVKNLNNLNSNLNNNLNTIIQPSIDNQFD